MAEEMLLLLEVEQKQEVTSQSSELKAIKAKISTFDVKLQRLTDVYVDGSLALSDYKQTKEKLLKQKLVWADKLTFIQKNKNARLEPVFAFIRGSTTTQIVATGDERVAHRNFLQKTGSNLRLQSGTLLWEARGAWKHVADAGFLTARVTTTSASAATSRAIMPTLCPEPRSARYLLEQIKGFFENHPT
jgi:hypothetical protein